MVGDSKEKEQLKDQVDILKNQVKIKDETLWEIKNLQKDDPNLMTLLKKTDEKVDKSIRESKGNKGVGLKNMADDIESQLRLEIEKLTFNYNYYRNLYENSTGFSEDNSNTNVQKDKIDQIEKLHQEMTKLKKENNQIKQHHQKNIDKFKEYQQRIKIDQEQKDLLLQKAMETIQKLKIQKDSFFYEKQRLEEENLRYKSRLDDLKNKIKQREIEAMNFRKFDPMHNQQTKIMDAKVHKPLVGGGGKNEISKVQDNMFNNV